VAGRALAFADPEIIRMAKEDYVPVTGDDWYQRRRDDPEGQFFRKVADQGPRKGEGGATRQGIYMLTAGGKLLAYKNAGQAPDVMREVLRRGLAEWSKLPVTERRPGAVRVEKLPKQDARYTRRPPTGGLIVDVYTRILDRDNKGGWCRGTCAVPGAERSARDHLWLTEQEWQMLLPPDAKKGDRFPVPPRIADRLLRFHLVDNTRGEPPMWKRDDVRSADLRLTVEEATGAGLRLRLDGAALLATDSDSAKAQRGFQAQLLGYLAYDAVRKTIDRFDIVAVGEHWGQGAHTTGARAGRTPLGIAFALAGKDAPANDVPPQGARDFEDYMGKAGN
jgi:hypothetical protein